MQEESRVLLKSKLPWISFAPPVITFAIGVFLMTQNQEASWLRWPLAGVGSLWLMRMVIVALTNTISLTSKRLTARTGLFSVSTLDLPLSSVEGIETKRDLFGLLLNYGTLVVRGSGSSKSEVYLVESPDSFRESAMRILAGDLPTMPETVTEKERLPLHIRILKLPPLITTTEKHTLVFAGDSDQIWHKLVDVLGLNDGWLSLPHFHESKNTSPDALSEGMKLEVVGLQGTIYPAKLTTWKPDERQLAVSLIDETELPSRTYSFSVHPASQVGQTEIQLALIHHLPFIHQFLTAIVGIFEGPVNFAETVLRMIADHIRGSGRPGLFPR